MNGANLKLDWLRLACAGLLLWGGTTWAQTETNETPVPPDSATNEAPAVVEPPVDVTPAPAGSSKTPRPPPAYRGSDMKDAFKGTGRSRFGVSGRVNKLPAKKAAKREKGSWRRNLELGLATARGNSDTLRYDGEVSASKETEQNYFYIKAGGRYGESDKEKDTENATGEARFQHRLTERMYGGLDGYALHDPVADLDYRARASLSLGRQFVRSERTALSVEIGPGYVAEKKDGASEGFAAGRVAQMLEFLVTDSLQIWQSVEYVPDFEDSRVYYVNAEVGLETVLLSGLSLKFTVEDRYDSNPAEGKESNDLLTTTALSWSF